MKRCKGASYKSLETSVPESWITLYIIDFMICRNKQNSEFSKSNSTDDKWKPLSHLLLVWAKCDLLVIISALT
jgi:hypothetical protein